MRIARIGILRLVISLKKKAHKFSVVVSQRPTVGEKMGGILANREF
jgi:hypothetical protein